ncbi:MAG: hypothetical protein WB383_00175 [Acidimicrobiales bacterium]
MAEAGRTVPGAGRHATVPLLGRIAVACYPPWWRARYGDGQLGFLADLHAEGRSGARALPNLMAGAVWTRLSGTGMPPTPSAWRNRARTSVTASALAAMPLMMLGLYASHRGGYWSGNGRLSTAGRVAEDAGNFAFFALALVLLMLAFGWRILISQAHELRPGAARRRYVAAMATPFIAVASGLGLWSLASHISPGGVTGGSYKLSPTTHRFYDVTVVVSPGDPRLVTFLHAAAIVCGFGGWLVAAMLVGRVAARRAPATARAIRTGVWLSRIGTGATVLLRLAISVYVAALALQPWHLVANHSCDDLPRALWAAGSCAPYSAPAGRAVLTGPLEGAAPFWIVLTLACAALAVVGTRIAGRSAKKAALLDAT